MSLILAVGVAAAGPVASSAAGIGSAGAYATDFGASEDDWMAPASPNSGITAGRGTTSTLQSTEPIPRPTQSWLIANHGRLPDDVKPSLVQARADEERLRGDGCLAFERVSQPPDCVYGMRDSTHVVALIGDSHAAQWFPAIERVAKHEGWRVLTFVKVSCPFVDMRVRNLLLQREYRECADFNDAVVRRLSTINPNVVFVSMSRIALRPVDRDDDTVETKGASVGRMLDRLPGRVILLNDIPNPGRDVPGCLSAHVDNVDACAIPRRTAFSDDFLAVEQTAVATSGATLIDLTNDICPVTPCPVVENDRIVYRDSSHMTATFSRSLAPALAASIGRLIRPSDPSDANS